MKLVFISLFSLLLGSCSLTPCKGNPEMMSSESSQNTTREETVWVSKPDGSKQCSKTGGLSLEEMAKQLGDIKILSQKQTTDGKMRVQMCGTPTGTVNTYEILKTDLTKAQAKGFTVFKASGSH